MSGPAHQSAGIHTVLPQDVTNFVPIRFGCFTSIASGLTVVSGQHPAVDAPEVVSNFPFAAHGFGEYPPSTEAGGVLVGSDVWIGQGVTLLDGITIGDGAVIAACSVVTKDVDDYLMVAGNPATPRYLRYTEAQVEALLRIRWWNWSTDVIKQRLPHFRHIDRFIERYDQDE
jgi:acetyltransferase-like isoleucine patch superfamily enzyme